MAGSSWGTLLTMTTWGESHGKGLGVVVDGCPAGLPLCEEDIQKYLDRRKPGQSRFTTKRQEGDQAEILSGVFEGKTTGTPISILVRNMDQRSHDYNNIKDLYRPGHGDYTFDAKYGFRDYRGGGRSSGRETIGRVAAGAIGARLLECLGVTVAAYTRSIGPVEINMDHFNLELRFSNSLCMPDPQAAIRAQEYVEKVMAQGDSAGGVAECVISGLPAGVGEPVFEKLDARLAHGAMSIGAVKGVEIGDGFLAAGSLGSVNNDSFVTGENGRVDKASNHAGGILGGISDGSQIVVRAAFKPTPSISRPQKTVNRDGQEVETVIKGRHDPLVVPRAVVVLETMAAFTVADMLLVGMSSRLDRIQRFFNT